jgi:O-antigen/teichoic acid export membrane protein
MPALTRVRAFLNLRSVRPSELSARSQVIAWDLLSTTIAAALVAIAGTFTYRLASTHFGPTGFGEYALVRRTLALGLPAVMVGVGVALPRQIAMRHAAVEDEALTAMSLLSSSFVIVALVMACVAGIVALQPTFAARLFFGSGTYAVLLPVLGASLGALCAQAICFGYLRGLLHMRAANLFLVLSLGACPLFAFALGTGVESVLWYNAALMYALSLACVIRAVVTQRASLATNRRAMRSLLAFGMPRVPGDFALAAVMAFPSIAAAHLSSVKTAGIVAFGTTLITLAGTAVSPLSTVLLPHSAVLVREGKRDVLRDSVAKVLPLFVVSAIVATLVLELCASWIIRHFLGTAFVSEVGSVRWMVAAIAPYTVFVACRSLNDSLYDRAVNAWNCYVALVACVVIAVGLFTTGQRNHAAEVAFVTSMWILALLTTWRVLRAEGDGPIATEG